MKKILFIVTASLLVLTVSCRRTDVRTLVVNVPEMRNSACAQLIVKKLSTQVGVKKGNDISVDLVARTVTVQYESLLTAKKNVEYAIAAVGFSANAIPANKDAASKLPKECKGTGIMVPMPVK
jgi:hypothetical protein